MNSLPKLITLACSPSKDLTQYDLLDLLSSDIDWTPIIEAASKHGVLPIFCKQLVTEYYEHLPPNLLDAMQTVLEQHQSNILNLNSALVTVLASLEHENIPSIPFKGPTLSERAFRDSELRLFSDLDILISEEDIDRAVTIFLKAGYKHQEHLTFRDLTAIRRYGGQYFMFHPKTNICVEPHWAFTPTTLSVDLDYKHIFSQAIKTNFKGQSILALTPEHEVLMLCIHASKEYWRSLKPITDLAWYINQHPELDWIRLITDARNWGCLRMLLVGIQLTHKILYCKIPPQIQPLINRDNKTHKLCTQLLDAMKKDLAPPINPYHIDLYRLDIRERWRDKLTFLLRTICTPRAQHFQMVKLPRSLSWLYIPIKLAWDYTIMPIWQLLKLNNKN